MKINKTHNQLMRYSQEMIINEIKNEIHDITKWEEKIKRKELKYETKKYTYDFQKSETIRHFGELIYTHTAKIVEVEE